MIIGHPSLLSLHFSFDFPVFVSTFCFEGLGFSAASGRRSDQFDQKRNFSFVVSHSRIKKRISNVEQGMSNIEGRNSIEFYGFKRQSAAIPHFYILRFTVLRFAVRPGGVSYECSAPPLAAEVTSLIEKKTSRSFSRNHYQCWGRYRGRPMCLPPPKRAHT